MSAATGTATAQPRLRTPQQLYEDWERSHWAAQDVDLTRDRSDWVALAEEERTLLYWVLSSLMVAEERISTQFCGLVLAQDDEEEGSYLSTQLVDEVRHMQFYARFQNEVIADPAAIGAHVARAREVLGAPFEKLFDEALVEAHDRLVRDSARPRGEGRLRDDLPHGHRGNARDHRVALPARLPERARPAARVRGRLRPHRRGRAAPHRLRDLVPAQAVRDDPSMADVIRARLFDLLPAVAESVSPPSEGAWDMLGVEDGALAQYGLGALTRRLKLIGVSLEQPA